MVLGSPPKDSLGTPSGYYCKVDLTKLVGEIVVAPFAENWLIDLVRAIAGRYELGDRVRKSTLSDDPTFAAHFLVPRE